MKELKKEVRLPNYCPKCKVNLATSDTCEFICYEMECGGIVLSQETLIEFENNKLNMKKTKELLIEMMQDDEELGLYQEEPKQERSYSEEEVKSAFKIGFNIGYGSPVQELDLKNEHCEKWFEQFKKK